MSKNESKPERTILVLKMKIFLEDGTFFHVGDLVDNLLKTFLILLATELAMMLIVFFGLMYEFIGQKVAFYIILLVSLVVGVLAVVLLSRIKR